MRPFWATRAIPYYPSQIHPALNSFADECCATLAHLLAYVGTLALLAIVGIHLWDQLPADEPSEPSVRPGWNQASRSRPAFAVSQLDLFEKTEAYEILRHPEGGRKDVLRWSAQGERPVAELEIYRPGGEFGQSGPAAAEMAARMNPNGGRELIAGRAERLPELLPDIIYGTVVPFLGQQEALRYMELAKEMIKEGG